MEIDEMKTYMIVMMLAAMAVLSGCQGEPPAYPTPDTGTGDPRDCPQMTESLNYVHRADDTTYYVCHGKFRFLFTDMDSPAGGAMRLSRIWGVSHDGGPPSYHEVAVCRDCDGGAIDVRDVPVGGSYGHERMVLSEMDRYLAVGSSGSYLGFHLRSVSDLYDPITGEHVARQDRLYMFSADAISIETTTSQMAYGEQLERHQLRLDARKTLRLEDTSQLITDLGCSSDDTEYPVTDTITYAYPRRGLRLSWHVDDTRPLVSVSQDCTISIETEPELLVTDGTVESTTSTIALYAGS